MYSVRKRYSYPEKDERRCIPPSRRAVRRTLPRVLNGPNQNSGRYRRTYDYLQRQGEHAAALQYVEKIVSVTKEFFGPVIALRISPNPL